MWCNWVRSIKAGGRGRTFAGFLGDRRAYATLAPITVRTAGKVPVYISLILYSDDPIRLHIMDLIFIFLE